MSSSTSTLNHPHEPTAGEAIQGKIVGPVPTPHDQLSRTATLDAEAQAESTDFTGLPSNARRYFLLFIFSTAQFLDIFGASAVIVGLSEMATDLNMTVAESTWIVNAYALTLASTLLTGGRIADITNPKIVFIVGFLILALLNMGVGLSKDKTTLLVLRAFSGLGASLTIPSATNLIVHLFPEPDKQATAIAIFGGSGAIANIFGLIIGGALLLGGWKWIFLFSTLLGGPMALASIWLIPNPNSLKHHVPKETKDGVEVAEKRKPKMDYLGTFLQTAAIVLLVFGLTEANVKGWGEPATIATVVVGALLFPVFLLWEAHIDPIDALIAPNLWRIPNFALLTVFGLSVGFWFFEAQVSFSDRFQHDWDISGIMTAVRFLPCGLAATVTMIWAQNYSIVKFPLKWRLVSGILVAAAAMLLFSFVDGRDDYWSMIFVGLIVGGGGAAMAFVGAFVSFIMSVPAEHSGLVGGLWNSVLQLGAAALLSITTTIQVNAGNDHGAGVPAASREGYRAGYLFAMGLLIFEAGLVLMFFKNPLELQAAETESTAVGEDEKKVDSSA